MVRDARAEDWPAVAGLLVELGRPEVRGTPEQEPARALFESYLDLPEAYALVAEIDGRVVGFIDMELRARLNFGSPEAWVPDLVITEDARRHGAGAALLGRAEELARQRGCWAISLESANWRTEAHTFYEAQGWKDLGRSFSKLLADIEWPPAPRT